MNTEPRKSSGPYIIDGIPYNSLPKIADKFGGTLSCYSKKFIILGRNYAESSEIIPGTKKTEVELEGVGVVRVGSLHRILKDLGKKAGFYKHVYVALGRPEKVSRKTFEDWIESRAEATNNINPEYADPNYLPHIPLGDLAHLSDKENTGAGKGEIPDEVWIEMMASGQFKTAISTKNTKQRDEYESILSLMNF